MKYKGEDNMEHISTITARVMAEAAKKALEDNLWSQVIRELGEPQWVGDNEMEIRAGVEYHQIKMAERYAELKKEAGLE
jgi:hypothetical protein